MGWSIDVVGPLERKEARNQRAGDDRKERGVARGSQREDHEQADEDDAGPVDPLPALAVDLDGEGDDEADEEELVAGIG